MPDFSEPTLREKTMNNRPSQNGAPLLIFAALLAPAAIISPTSSFLHAAARNNTYFEPDWGIRGHIGVGQSPDSATRITAAGMIFDGTSLWISQGENDSVVKRCITDGTVEAKF